MAGQTGHSTQSHHRHSNMKTLVLMGVVALASAKTRYMLDEEEFIDAKAFRDEALEVEREVARLNLQQGLGHHYVEPAPLSEGRHLGLGLGVQLGPIGAGASAGLGHGGVGFNSALGYGHNYLVYGSPAHYSQYYASPAPLQSRTVGFGTGLNLGPVGLGASAGIGHGQIGVAGGFGFGGQYSNYGNPAHYQQYHSLPYNGPWFHPGQLV